MSDNHTSKAKIDSKLIEKIIEYKAKAKNENAQFRRDHSRIGYGGNCK